MRRAAVLAWVVVAVLASGGCCGGARQAPWPASAGTVVVEDWHDDGGESLAPRRPTTAIEASAEASSDADATDAEASADAVAAEVDASDAVTDDVEVDDENVIYVEEEITIDIGDDDVGDGDEP
ncbi:MAG: hypothetical protein R2939_09015 [Kofleriaceae bacterium]